jgi:hypothetical protein
MKMDLNRSVYISRKKLAFYQTCLDYLIMVFSTEGIEMF